MNALLAALLSALVLPLGCGTSSSDSGRVFSENDREIAVVAGETFMIALPANPSIGDDWRVVGEPDPAVVALVDEERTSDNPDPNVVGAGGTATFAFAAVDPGTTEVTIFNCYRCLGDDEPTEENRAFSETLVFSVRVS